MFSTAVSATSASREAFRTWLYMTVRNACLMKRRRRAGEPSTFVSIEHGIETAIGTVHMDVADSSRPTDQRLIDGWVDARLRHALKQLSPSLRMVVVMREIECLSRKKSRPSPVSLKPM
jgi:DNA-directed RNA polymerase specialized sigma24 family protein